MSTRQRTPEEKYLTGKCPICGENEGQPCKIEGQRIVLVNDVGGLKGIRGARGGHLERYKAAPDTV